MKQTHWCFCDVIYKNEYIDQDDFLINSFWSEIWFKFCLNYGIAIAVFLPLCMLRNLSKLRFASSAGVNHYHRCPITFFLHLSFNRKS